MNLLEILTSEDEKYESYLKEIKNNAQNNNISNILDNVYKRLKNNLPGNNILRYLLVKTDNIVIKDQLNDEPNRYINNLSALDTDCCIEYNGEAPAK